MGDKLNNAKQDLANKRKAAKDAVQRAKAKAKAKENTVTAERLELMVTVVNRNKTEYYVDLIQSFDVNMQVIALAHGTADATTLRYLGLTDTNKGVIFSVIQQKKIPDALAALEHRFATVKGGKGIAFTLPMTSVIGTLLYGFLSNNKDVVKEKK